jgi:hypothetical protein
MQLQQPPCDDLTQRFWLAQHRQAWLGRFALFSNHMRWGRMVGVLLAGVALALAVGNAPVAYAADIDVTTNDPAINADDECSLIEAIVNANNDAATYIDCREGSGADTITLAGGIYTLSGVNNVNTTGSNGLPIITSTITIQGNGATIERGGPPAEDYRIFEIANPGFLTLNDTTITGGANTPGAGIFNDHGTLILNNSSVRGNTNESVDGGGIVNNGGTVRLRNSTISDNSASSGGGLVNTSGGDLRLSNSTVSGNSAEASEGGILNLGLLWLTNSTVSDNRASTGGNLHNSGGTVTLMNTILANSLGGGNCVGQGGTIDISGDERDAPAHPQEGTTDALTRAGRFTTDSTIIKFERQTVSAAGAEGVLLSFDGFLVDPTTLTDESGAEFLTEPVGEEAPTEAAGLNRIFLPVVTR